MHVWNHKHFWLVKNAPVSKGKELLQNDDHKVNIITWIYSMPLQSCRFFHRICAIIVRGNPTISQKLSSAIWEHYSFLLIASLTDVVQMLPKHLFRVKSFCFFKKKSFLDIFSQCPSIPAFFHNSRVFQECSPCECYLKRYPHTQNRTLNMLYDYRQCCSGKFTSIKMYI